MSIVLDTHAVLWHLEQASELSPVAQRAIENAINHQHPLYISAISLSKLCTSRNAAGSYQRH